MKKALTFIKSKLALAGIVVVAAVIGGATTSLVRASIPDGNGTIHSCYSTGRGSLYIIDSSSQSCGTGETGLNWNQNGAVVLHDADSQTLGDVLSHANTGTLEIEVYNHTLNRIVKLIPGDDNHMDVGQQIVPYFESHDCSGQAYVMNSPAEWQIKTSLLRWSDGSTDHYATVATAASDSSVTYNSRLAEGSCSEISDTTNLYTLTSATLPFDTPVTTPLKF